MRHAALTDGKGTQEQAVPRRLAGGIVAPLPCRSQGQAGDGLRWLVSSFPLAPESRNRQEVLPLCIWQAYDFLLTALATCSLPSGTAQTGFYIHAFLAGLDFNGSFWMA